jgi:uncharacterized C2H2 Zn-finger protein
LKHFFSDLDNLSSHEADFFSTEAEAGKLDNLFDETNLDGLTSPVATRTSTRLQSKKPFKCDRCDKSFKSNGFFIRHVESCGGENVNDVEDILPSRLQSAKRRGLFYFLFYSL